jgi:hypothetical protein
MEVVPEVILLSLKKHVISVARVWMTLPVLLVASSKLKDGMYATNAFPKRMLLIQSPKRMLLKATKKLRAGCMRTMPSKTLWFLSKRYNFFRTSLMI